MSRKPKKNDKFSQSDSNDHEFLNDADVVEVTDEHGGKKTFYQTVSTNRTYQIGIGAIVVLLAIVLALAFYSSSVSSELDAANAEKEQMDGVLTQTKQQLEQINAALNSEQAESSQTQQMLAETKQALEGQIAKLETSLHATKSKVGDLKEAKRQAMLDKRKAMAELAQFKQFSRQFQRMIDAGKLEVVFRRGRMVVNLPAQVLFDSGSAHLSDEGMAALKDVAKVLRNVKNRRFIVGGHTDNRKIVKASYESNWELASARATVVTRELIKAGMPPGHLIAAGYAQYAPIANNATDAGRQKNRRIEIILEPFLKDIDPPKNKAKSKSNSKKTASSTTSKSKKKNS